jgi:hypothetical protein
MNGGDYADVPEVARHAGGRGIRTWVGTIVDWAALGVGLVYGLRSRHGNFQRLLIGVAAREDGPPAVVTPPNRDPSAAANGGYKWLRF